MHATATDRLIHAALADLPAPVTLISYTSDIDSWYSRAERELLERITAASRNVRLDVRAERWTATREAEVGIRRTPCLAVLGADDDPGVRYYGLPDGYELETFLDLMRAVATRRHGLTAETVGALHDLPHRLHLEVFASPT